MDQVRFLVASGHLLQGEELPSTRVLSADLGVNPMTVSKAYGILEDEGILTRRPGLPLVVSRRTAGSEDQTREEALVRVLEPAVLAARQLGISDCDAIEHFRRALAARPQKEPPA